MFGIRPSRPCQRERCELGQLALQMNQALPETDDACAAGGCLLNSRGGIAKPPPRMMSILYRPLQAQGNAVCCALLLAAVLGTRSALKAETPPSPRDAEPNSPSEMSPGLVEPGLTSRAVPSPPTAPDSPDLNAVSFYWRVHPFDNLALMLPRPPPFSSDDPSTFRPVVNQTPPLGLNPKIYRAGLLEFYPWAGIAQSFDSNVQLVQHDQISDFFATPRFGLEMQLGTPDSVRNEFYDTILAAHLSYEGYADLFY